MRRTPLYEEHLRLSATLINHAAWALPQRFSSQVNEHNAVRNDVGIFDISHMSLVELEGSDALAFLRSVLCGDVATLKDSQAMYTCMCARDGGVIADLIVYRLSSDHYRLVLNAASSDADMQWLEGFRPGFGDLKISLDSDRAMIAVQGPNTAQRLADVGLAYPEARFSSVEMDDGTTVARTGYTGEDGVELILEADNAVKWWRALLEAGATPCGMAARDSLRIEAGMALYGQDLHRGFGPYSSGLGWLVDLRDSARNFIGRHALTSGERDGEEQLINVMLPTEGVLRASAPIYANGEFVGVISSGGYSPSSGRAIGLARVAVGKGEYAIETRGQKQALQLVDAPFLSDRQSIAS